MLGGPTGNVMLPLGHYNTATSNTLKNLPIPNSLTLNKHSSMGIWKGGKGAAEQLIKLQLCWGLQTLSFTQSKM